MRYEIDLPFPPSVNRIWRVGVRKLYSSPAYEAWKIESDVAFWQQFGGSKKRPQSLGNFTISIVLDENRRGISDSDNRIKPVLDFCQRAGFVINDRGCDGGSWAWGTAPAGCRVTLTGEPHDS